MSMNRLKKRRKGGVRVLESIKEITRGIKKKTKQPTSSLKHCSIEVAPGGRALSWVVHLPTWHQTPRQGNPSYSIVNSGRSLDQRSFEIKFSLVCVKLRKNDFFS